MRKFGIGLALIALLMAASSAARGIQIESAQAPAKAAQPKELQGNAGAALRRAADKDQYLFMFFYRKNDNQTQKLQQVLNDCVEKWSDRASAISVDVSDAHEKDAVERFDLGHAPMPIVLAVAPNGAVTGGFPKQFDELKLARAFVSHGMAACLKHLQDQKTVFLAVQNNETRHNDSALRGVRAVKSDPQYAATTEIVTIDPSRPEEAKTLQQFKIDPQTREAVTVLLAPPGTTLGTYTGTTSKDELVAALKKKASACSGASGCCPKK